MKMLQGQFCLFIETAFFNKTICQNSADQLLFQALLCLIESKHLETSQGF